MTTTFSFVNFLFTCSNITASANAVVSADMTFQSACLLSWFLL